MRPARTLSPNRLALPIALIGLLIHGCSADPAVYKARGIVREIDPGPPKRILIEHEAIAGFKDRDGHSATMPTMKMAFGLVAGIDASAFKVGDRITFRFNVDYQRSETLILQSFAPLANDTALQLGAKSSP